MKNRIPVGKNIAIVGFGLLGTSLGMALKGKGFNRFGWSRRQESRTQALGNKVVDKVFNYRYHVCLNRWFINIIIVLFL